MKANDCDARGELQQRFAVARVPIRIEKQTPKNNHEPRPARKERNEKKRRKKNNSDNDVMPRPNDFCRGVADDPTSSATV